MTSVDTEEDILHKYRRCAEMSEIVGIRWLLGRRATAALRSSGRPVIIKAIPITDTGKEGKMTGRLLAIGTVLVLLTTPAMAQTQEYKPLEIGAEAPDFALPGATREGVLDQPLRLSDYKGKTVVLAFFYHARTKG
jgi:hypothetical protein